MNVKSGNFLDLDQAPPCISCSFRRFDPEECHVTRVSDSDVLLLMLEGELIFWEDGRRISLLPGQWYIQKAGLVQEGREPSRLPFYYYLHFLGSYGNAPRHPLPLSGQFQPEEFLPLLHRMDAAWRMDGSEIAKRAAFFEIFSRLESSAPEKPFSGTVTRMIAYLSEHLSEGVRVSDLAREFRYSEDHVIRLFRRWRGTTPHRCIQDMRLRQARQLLETTDRSIPAIAAQTGYGDPSAFYRAFRQEMGFPPGEWRRRRNAAALARREPEAAPIR